MTSRFGGLTATYGSGCKTGARAAPNSGICLEKRGFMPRRHLNVFTFETMEPRRLLAATTWRIDAGSIDGHVEATGKTWRADDRFTAGIGADGSAAIAGTTEDDLFASHRSGNFAYSLPIRNGRYRVKFLFA